MKNLILIALFIPSLSFSQVTERTFEAVVRNEDNRPVVEEVVLTDLVSNDSFDGEYFKIVKGKSDEAIKFDDKEEGLTFRAATVYHHLMVARNYFVDKVKSSYVASMPKLTIRIQLTNQFYEQGPFKHDNAEPQYNNALTIPAGKSFRGDKSWGIEIWFRPSKKVHLRDLKVNNSQTQEFTVLMANFRKQTHMQSLQLFLTNAVRAMTVDGAPDPLAPENLIRTVGSSLIMEAGYQLFDPITKAFTRKWYWLDTALVPEIIYHEFAHVAMSETLKLNGSTAVVEGIADFFAGKIANSPKLAMKIKKYNTYNGKNAERKHKYQLEFETTGLANTDFVFGVLWEMGKIVGDDKSDDFMFNLGHKLKPSDTIRVELIEALLKTCEEQCTAPFVDSLRMRKALNLKGI